MTPENRPLNPFLPTRSAYEPPERQPLLGDPAAALPALPRGARVPRAGGHEPGLPRLRPAARARAGLLPGGHVHQLRAVDRAARAGNVAAVPAAADLGPGHAAAAGVRRL